MSVIAFILLVLIAVAMVFVAIRLRKIERRLKGESSKNRVARRVAARKAKKDGMEITDLDLRHTENCKLLPNREMLLNMMPKDAVVAEVGSAFGDFSNEILQRCAPKQLHLVDSWASERYQIGLKTIKKNLADEISADRLHIHQGLSTEVLPTFEGGFFDWVYIDTNHSYETTLEELLICDSKVSETGRIAGHDFCTGNVIDAVPYGVVEAVTKFCKDRNWQFEYLTVESHGHFSFCLRRLG
ncbi:class I SAM-dependent methyltransferase [Ruegeria sp. SCP11]|uniref:class I SAM-dependent methyltransferase n=1 Tax=Ruegeria sp. SCP11 TaxID=3141378 RepID=UPI00333B7BCC